MNLQSATPVRPGYPPSAPISVNDVQARFLLTKGYVTANPTVEKALPVAPAAAVLEKTSPAIVVENVVLGSSQGKQLSDLAEEVPVALEVIAPVVVEKASIPVTEIIPEPVAVEAPSLTVARVEAIVPVEEITPPVVEEEAPVEVAELPVATSEVEGWQQFFVEFVKESAAGEIVSSVKYIGEQTAASLKAIVDPTWDEFKKILTEKQLASVKSSFSGT